LLKAAAEREARSLGKRALGVFGLASGTNVAERVADLMMTGVAVQAAQPATVAVGLSRRHGLARGPVVDGAGMLLGMAGPVEVLDALHRAELVA
ncbi:hypothetical protein, partial [Acinetobacter baumannii]|uniref:hypothetical protein n=1 Tax=Acinetobacter baumannii TaxID=470 RepID=UPI0028A2417F